jgi:GNAT superfamily N-acetyltransferase
MSDPIIHVLAPDDLEAALTLSSTAGWNQRRADWRMLLRLAPGGSFAATIDGRIIGTAVGIDYGGFAWIAMMLVDPAWRGRGVGRRLLEAAMMSVPSDRPIRLDATPMGRPLYQRYGFADEALLARHVTDASRPAASAAPPRESALVVRPLTAADLPNVAARDREVFGGDRRAVLEWMRDDAAEYARLAMEDDEPPQYCLGRHGRLFDQIGPVVARDDDGARRLVSAALLTAGTRPVALDVFDARPDFAAWLGANGFRIERPLYRMRRSAGGQAPATDAVDRPRLAEYAILGPEFA